MEKSSGTVQALGMVWYRESDYEELLTLFTDAEKLPRSFLQWQDMAEQGRKRYVRQGVFVVKAYIDPRTFPAWCEANGCGLDANGRMKFGNAEAYRVAMEAQRGGTTGTA